MTVFMFSLAGVPPMVGFFGKLAVIQALVSTNVTLYIVLAVVAVLFSLIGAFYYLRVVKVMWFDEAGARRAARSCAQRRRDRCCWPSMARRCCCLVCSPAA
jgi:NADH-quinone oxidoreductase subunit N